MKAERWGLEQARRVLRLVASLRVKTLDRVRKQEFLQPTC